MNTYLIASLGILALVVAYGTLTYNRLVTLKHNVNLSWSNIDVLLKQRHDELPKLVEVCRQYMKFEQDTLEKVMLARSAVATAQAAGDLGALGAAEARLKLGMGNLFATVEAYPELRASDKFKHLEARITGLENAIADRRELYNETVNLNNVRIEQFPEIFLARYFSFRPFKLLELAEEQKQDVDLRELFG
jgi:LemA protein